MLNRIYLVSAGVLSLSIPFIRLEWLTEQKAAQQVYTSVNWDAVLQQATIVTESNPGFNWANVFVYVYCVGIVFFFCKLIFNLLTVKKLINTAKAGSAFSFFSSKIVDKDLPLVDVINIHEEAHIKQWHTADILFFEILGVFTWLNPIVYFYKKSIKNIHEFLADEHAAEFQGDKAEYAMLILSQSFGISPNKLTNGFFDKSLIKKRIFMLQKERSKKTVILKYGFFIPLFAILIIFSSATIRKNEKLIAISDQIPMDKPIEMVQEIITAKNDLKNVPLSKSESILPTDKIKDDWNSFYRFMGKSIKYPADAKAKDLQGNTQIKFTLQNNKITNASTVLDLGGGCDEEVMKALLSFKEFKKLPNGKYTLKVGFRLHESDAKIQNSKIITLPAYQKLADLTIVGYPGKIYGNIIDENDEKVHDFVSIEKQPEFPGGIRKFYEYLGRSIKYPKEAMENNVQGKVFLSYIVEKDGSLTDIKIMRGLGSGTDEEAIRVLKESPKWNPGLTDGKAVRVKYNINVNFNLHTDVPVETKTGNVKVYDVVPGLGFRGTNLKSNTLVILDGNDMGLDFDFRKIDPQNIQSISVLKDVSATSLYGNKGKNGVLVITTKNNISNKIEDIDLKMDKNSPIIKLRERF